MKNWKTTIAALGLLLAALGKAIGEYTSGGVSAVDFSVLLGAISGSVGLFAAKDFNVSGTGK
jgi:hypothetical protein